MSGVQQDAFRRAYGAIGEHYDEDTWLERYGVWTSAWQEAVAAERPSCVWVHETDCFDDYYEASCGYLFQLSNDGSLAENRMNYCPKCGGRLVVRTEMKPEQKAKRGQIWRDEDGNGVEILEDDIHGRVGNVIVFRRLASGWKGSMKKFRFYRRYRCEASDV